MLGLTRESSQNNNKILLLAVVAMLIVSSTHAFSAQLPRPWDGSVSTQKGAARSVTILRISQIPTKGSSASEENNQSDEVNEDNIDDEEDEEEILSLADTEGVSGPSSSAVAIASSSPSKPESKAVSVVSSSPDDLNKGSSTTDSTAVAEYDPSQSTPAEDITPTVRSCLPDLIKMTRPTNDPAVVMLHMLGVYLALQTANQGLGLGLGYWRFLASPSMMVVLVALLLTSSTSMLVNDYYDYKLGHDSLKINKPLVSNKVPLKVAKRFTSYLYAAALFTVTVIPGVPSRMAVVSGLMLTFWYTQHLKPRTWLKNVVCASLIALSPLASGGSALTVLSSRIPDAAARTSGMLFKGYGPILRVFGMMFFAIVGREMTMDINDVNDDKVHGVRTVSPSLSATTTNCDEIPCVLSF